MAIASETHSLEDINYRSPIRPFFLVPILSFILSLSFLSYYSIADKIKVQIKKATAGTCSIDYNNVHFDFLPPRMVIDDLTIPASCLGKSGAPIRLTYLNLGFRLISFSPIGVPFKIDTSYNGQPFEFYYVLGLGGQTIRVKDQHLDLSRFENLMGNFKLGGKVTLDITVQTNMAQKLTALNIKAQSDDFKIPAQTVMKFNFPDLAVRKFYLETNSDNFPTLRVEKFILGDTESPIRLDLKGTIKMSDFAMESPLRLDGELAFSEQFKQNFLLVTTLLVNETYTVKDGFYQVSLGGTLGAPQLQPR